MLRKGSTLDPEQAYFFYVENIFKSYFEVEWPVQSKCPEYTGWIISNET